MGHGIVYEDTSSTWTVRHRAWVRSQDLGGGAQVTLLDHVGAIDTLEHRRDQLKKAIGELVPDSPYADTVARLRCLRGIDTLSAAGLTAEIGDLTRFERPGKLMSYLGLVPSENSSGETRRQVRITKTGSKHARRLLVEASWHRKKTPARGVTLQRRQEGQSATVVAIRQSVEEGGASPANAREHRRSNREQPGKLCGPRSILDSTALTTKPGPAARRTAYRSLTARRATRSTTARPAAPLDRQDARRSRGHPAFNP